MSRILDEVLAANKSYAAQFGDKGKLSMPPARHFAVLTCMDARLDPAKFAGLAEGDAHVIRNAGGRASDDAIRSLVISYKLLVLPCYKRTIWCRIVLWAKTSRQAHRSDALRHISRAWLKPQGMLTGTFR